MGQVFNLSHLLCIQRKAAILLRHSASPCAASSANRDCGGVDGKTEQALKASPDPYTRAHLEDIRARAARTRDAAYLIER